MRSQESAGRGPRVDAARALTLLNLFVVASAAVLVTGAIVLSWVLTDSLRAQALADRKESLGEYVDGVLAGRLIRNGRLEVDPAASRSIERALERRADLVAVKVWQADGTLVWASHDASSIGMRFPLDGRLGEAIRENRSSAGIDDLESAESSKLRRAGVDRLLEVYAPVRGPGGRPLGAYEISSDPSFLEASIAGRKYLTWGAVGGVFLGLYVVLVLLVRQASATMRRQTVKLRQRSHELLDSYRRLEESSLEAIESLNATVEAKDPYTAGHSRRVQRIALAIGRELDLGPEKLDALRLGALLHDIGKLGVPDSVLTKTGPLTPEELAQMKLHTVEGARIVGKLARLRAAVPVVLHHHERWDGAGYPDGLVGDAIPVEAAIAGLADAFDAMTTERSHAPAMTHDEAFAQIRAGRGTQFAPAVVDAFFEVARRRPGVLNGATASAAVRATAG